MAVLIFFAAEASARTIREVRVTKVRENSEAAFYAADAGFNRVRARLIMRGTDSDLAALDGRVEDLTYVEGASTVISATYTLQVTKLASPANTWRVVSTGTAGSGRFATKRVVSGTIQWPGTTKIVRIRGVNTVVNNVVTTYDP